MGSLYDVEQLYLMNGEGLNHDECVLHLTEEFNKMADEMKDGKEVDQVKLQENICARNAFKTVDEVWAIWAANDIGKISAEEAISMLGELLKNRGYIPPTGCIVEPIPENWVKKHEVVFNDDDEV